MAIMTTQSSLGKGLSDKDISPLLQTDLKTISEKCINCELCQKECAFLKKYGKPKDIADSYNPLLT